MEKKTLGIIGGVGPLATMFIGEMIVRRTAAEKDQDHVEMIITNNPNIPDRTAFILGDSDENPVPVILKDAERLKVSGADVLIMPCNTAHSFYDEIQKGAELRLLNMVDETVVRAKESGARRVGILATTGTITTEVYQTACERVNITPVIPDEQTQSLVMSLIYDDIKAGNPADPNKWHKVEEKMREVGCDQLILGCTELSIVRQELKLEGSIIDSLLVLAETAIEYCGYKLN